MPRWSFGLNRAVNGTTIRRNELSDQTPLCTDNNSTGWSNINRRLNLTGTHILTIPLHVRTSSRSSLARIKDLRSCDMGPDFGAVSHIPVDYHALRRARGDTNPSILSHKKSSWPEEKVSEDG